MKIQIRLIVLLTAFGLVSVLSAGLASHLVKRAAERALDEQASACVDIVEALVRDCRRALRGAEGSSKIILETDHRAVRE